MRLLEENLKAVIREAYRKVADSSDSFKSRTSQRQMIAEVARTLGAAAEGDAEEGPCPVSLIEAPTGTGKTLAYLVAGIPVAQARKKTLVVSSATIALQEQLVLRDLPWVERVSGLEFRFEIAKGRGRYICKSRLLERLEDQQKDNAGLFPDEMPAPMSEPMRRTAVRLKEALDAGEWNGDRDRWSGPLDDALWQTLTNDRYGCVGNRCSHFKHCSFYIERGKLEQADVIVANHDLVLADLSLGGGYLLPAPEDCLYIFDEAHHLPSKALSHFSARAPVRGGMAWLEGCGQVLARIAPYLPDGQRVARLIQDAEVLAADVVEQLQAVYRLCEQLSFSEQGGDGEAVCRFELGRLPEPLKQPANDLTGLTERLGGRLDAMAEVMRKAVNEGRLLPLRAEMLMPPLGLLQRHVQRLHEVWALMGQVDEPGRPPAARWVVRHRSGSRTDFRVEASPVTAAGMLRYALWHRAAAVVATSATLTALGRFERFMTATGVPGGETTSRCVLPTPFDPSRQAELWLPRLTAEPDKAEAHTRAVIDLLPELFLPTGNLVLFSSRRQMMEVADGLGQRWRETLLIQGNASREKLLQQHRERVEAGETSILMGMASFAEGLDLPGRLCEQVIIAKLPFSAPDGPVEATMDEWIRQRGGNSFMEVSLPDAAQRLVQAAGRLLRTEEDQGRIVILDRRLLTRRYGRQLLASLPPFRQRLDA